MKHITTLTGPSCAGKSTLERMMVDRGCLRAVSTTTRPPRPGEKEGVDYYFVDKEEFKRLDRAGAFVETTRFGDNYYGLSQAEVERLFSIGDHIVVVVEPEGMRQIRFWVSRQKNIELKTVFVTNPTSVIAERFIQRVLTEFKAAGEKNSPDADQELAKTIKNYAKRLSVMIDEESGWKRSAHLYNALISHFDAENGDSVADFLAGTEMMA